MDAGTDRIQTRIVGIRSRAYGIDDTYGFGLLDAYGAVGGRTAVSPPRPNDSTHEPNDVPDRAKPLAANGSVIPLGSLTPEGDVDWFYVDAPGNGSITFRLYWAMPSARRSLTSPRQIKAPSPSYAGRSSDCGRTSLCSPRC